MKTAFKILIIILAAVLILVFIIPFLIPVPPLKSTVPVEQLVDPDSLFMDFNGVPIHYKVRGSGEPAFILLHGFAASIFSWREVIQPLSEIGTVVAFDRPGFGLSGRPLKWEGTNPYTPEAQTDLVIALMDFLDIRQAILVGNSAGGTISAFTALRYPDRIQALIFVDAAIYSGGGAPDWIKPLLKTPQMRRLGPLVSRSLLGRSEELLELAWHDPSKATPEVLEGYQKATQVENWDKALWEFTLASRDLKLSERLDELHLPVLVITGDDDRIVPTVESIRLAEELPQARLVIIPNCGHVPQEECPQEFLKAVEEFITAGFR